jgi:acetyltransferase-like isoleucine patch superfamily enzyme
MRSIKEIKKDSKPIVFLGSCHNIQNLVELCNSSGREVIGLIDPDYDSQKEFYGLPVLQKKPYINEPEKYEFFVATWWTPFQNNVHRRNLKKRRLFLAWMESYKFTGATVIHDTAVISPKAMIDSHVSVGALSILVQNCQIHKHTNIREQCYVSHDVVVDSNCVLQMKSTVTGSITVGSNTYIGPGATVVNGSPLNPMHIGNNVIIHPNQLVLESVADNTIVSYKKAPFVVTVDQ